MNKKFFNLLLMGALAVASIGTVSSCKDYDDDINNLQDQINKAALKTEVEALQTTVTNAQTAAATAQTTAESALAKAGTNATDIAAVKATAAELGQKVADAITKAENAQDAAENAQDAADKANAAIAELDEKVQELAEAHATFVTTTKLLEDLNDLEEKITNAYTEQIDGLKDTLKIYKSAIDQLYSAVTGVELIGSWSASAGFTTAGTTTYTTTFNPFNVAITCGKVGANYTFGKDDACYGNGSAADGHKYSANSTVTYVKNTPFCYSDGKLVVRVNPTNAALTKDMIKFIDSKGDDLDDVIEVVEVKKFDELLTRGTGNKTGLWTLTLKSKKDGDGLDKAVKNNAKQVLYAIGVNNTKSQAETVADAKDRYVVSTYDATFSVGTYTAPTSLENVEVKSASKTTWTKIGSSATVDADGTPLISVNNGETFEVRFTDATTYLPNAEYFYVVRDDEHAKLSGSSEYNAWKSYDYEGLCEMIAVNHGEGKATLKVTIPSTQQVGDEIQFRVFAIDYAGTVIPNKAFRVYVGADRNVASVTGDLKIAGYQKMETDLLPITGTLKAGSTLPATVKVKNEGSTNEVTLTATYYKEDKTTTTSKPEEAKYVQFTVKDEVTHSVASTTAATLQKLTDGAVATGVIGGKDADDKVVINQIDVTLTKVMPTSADVDKYYENAGTAWKASQLDEDGVYTAYLYPVDNAWTTAWNEGNPVKGYKDLNQAINNLPSDTHATLTVANVSRKANEAGKQAYIADTTVTSSGWKLLIPSAADQTGTKLINNTTKHAAAFGYDFGAISSVKNSSDQYVTTFKKDASDAKYKFEIIFANPLHESVQTYAFAKKGSKEVNVLKYDNAVPVNLTNADNIGLYLKATNSYDNTTFDGTFYTADDKGVRYTKYPKECGNPAVSCASAKLISNSTKTEDYFTVTIDEKGLITFSPNPSSTTPPVEDVSSTLVLTLIDCFNEKHVYELPFTVKK